MSLQDILGTLSEPHDLPHSLNILTSSCVSEPHVSKLNWRLTQVRLARELRSYLSQGRGGSLITPPASSLHTHTVYVKKSCRLWCLVVGLKWKRIISHMVVGHIGNERHTKVTEGCTLLTHQVYVNMIRFESEASGRESELRNNFHVFTKIITPRVFLQTWEARNLLTILYTLRVFLESGAGEISLSPGSKHTCRVCVCVCVWNRQIEK